MRQPRKYKFEDGPLLNAEVWFSDPRDWTETERVQKDESCIDISNVNEWLWEARMKAAEKQSLYVFQGAQVVENRLALPFADVLYLLGDALKW